MNKLYIITGAAGHLGSTLVRLLEKTGAMIRGLILPTEHRKNAGNITYFSGDIRQKETLYPLFKDSEAYETTVIHTAGLIDISDHVSPQLYDVNVNGTRNLLEVCRQVSHPAGWYMSARSATQSRTLFMCSPETDAFSPDQVVGGYAKTKAAATQLVLDAAQEGLDAVVVHPSGILGPYDACGNHLVQLVRDYMYGKLPACVKGGYDFVDVRDVAAGCLLAAEKGQSGQCYILSNRHYEIREILAMVRKSSGCRKVPVLPMWMAKLAAPFMELDAKRRHRRPLYTRYSLHALCSNDRFSHDKATKELGYQPRDLRQTIRDTVSWLQQQAVLHGQNTHRHLQKKKRRAAANG